MRSAYSSSRNKNFVSTSSNLLKSRNLIIPVVRYFTWKLEFVSNILWMIADPQVFFFSFQVCMFSSNTSDIIIDVPQWWEKCLSKRDRIKHTCSWSNKPILLWTLNRKAKILLHIREKLFVKLLSLISRSGSKIYVKVKNSLWSFSFFQIQQNLLSK